ncbi:MAG: hypothetical protein ACLFN2_02785 [Bacteroidales bacterium]
MQASVEISMYPLGREYVSEIQDFIDRIKMRPGIEAEVNGMSTQLFGDYRTIMQALTDEMAVSFDQEGKSVFVMKVINSHLKQ